MCGPSRSAPEPTAPEPTASAADGPLNRGLLVYSAGDTPAAAGLFRRALEVDPRNPLAHYVLGLALKAMGRDEEALQEWRATVETEPAGDRPEDERELWARRHALNLLRLLENWEPEPGEMEQAAGLGWKG